MKNTTKKHFLLSLLLLIVLSAAMVCSLVACDRDEPTDHPQGSETELETVEEATFLGTGNVPFTVEVTHADGTTKSFTIKTDRETVADALTEVGLISGEQGAYGLYILTVDGEYHKWEDDGKFWAFYVNGESSMVGAGGVEVKAGDTYAFRVE